MYDRITAWFCLTLAVVIGIVGYQLGPGVLQNPGPGFMPLIAAGLIGFFSILLLLRGVNPSKRSDPFRGVLWYRIILTLSLLLFYSLILQRAGYILSTFLIMASLFRLIKKPSWFSVIFWSALSSLASFLIFNTWLEVALPVGFLGF